MNTNGVISFRSAFENLPLLALPLVGPPIIAPFLADVDTQVSGVISYRESNDQELLSSVGNAIRRSFENSRGFRPTLLFIATWSGVGRFNGTASEVGNVRFIWLL